MGELAARTIFSNDTGPLAGVGLDTLAKNQGAILELEGARAPQARTISNGSISPTAAYVIVDTEGGAAADDLMAINNVPSVSENLHDGMIIYLKAADSGRVVTVKNSTSANGINTYDGNDYVLSPTHWLKLQLRSGKWYEVEGRAMETALAAATAAAAASTGLAPRMDAVETKNTQQDARLDAVEAKNTQQDTALAGKTNVDMSNLSSTGKHSIADLVSPSSNKVSMAMPADGATVTSPGNGYLQLSSTPGATSYFALFNMTSGLRSRAWGEYSGHSVDIFVPVSTNDVVQVWCNTNQAKTLDFISRKGNV